MNPSTAIEPIVRNRNWFAVAVARGSAGAGADVLALGWVVAIPFMPVLSQDIAQYASRTANNVAGRVAFFIGFSFHVSKKNAWIRVTASMHEGLRRLLVEFPRWIQGPMASEPDSPVRMR
jgi:hypothetical protein